jgi:NitT/TauT family transport system ATP-binding protein
MRTVRLEGVSKNYDGVVVVRDLSLEVCSGEIVALLGQTGAGKSTILNMIMGQTAPSGGEVRINDLDPRGGDPKLRGLMAVSFQTDRLLPWRTAEQNVQLGLEYLGVSRRDRTVRARDWLNRVKLSEIHHTKFPHQLSGGMRQRVSLARAMSIDPQLVLLDESFSQLDHTTSQVLREDFVKLVKELKKTCLLITHRIDDAIEMADRIVVISAPASIKLELRTNRSGADRQMLTRMRDQITAVLADAPHTEPPAKQN